jgi:hypothetical protein
MPSNTRKKTKRKGGATAPAPKNIILGNSISFSSNTESDYKSIGIAHVTESAGMNVLRDIGTSWLNLVGQKGFESSVHDYCREQALRKLMKLLTTNQKICDVKLDVETNKTTILIHAYGTIYEKK